MPTFSGVFLSTPALANDQVHSTNMMWDGKGFMGPFIMIFSFGGFGLVTHLLRSTNTRRTLSTFWTDGLLPGRSMSGNTMKKSSNWSDKLHGKYAANIEQNARSRR